MEARSRRGVMGGGGVEKKVRCRRILECDGNALARVLEINRSISLRKEKESCESRKTIKKSKQTRSLGLSLDLLVCSFNNDKF